MLTNTPQWVLEEAKEQEAWISAKKAEKAAIVVAKTSPAASHTNDGKQLEVEDALRVECAGCGEQFEWSQLALGDGLCGACVAGEARQGMVDQHDCSSDTDSQLIVECTNCGIMASWKVLQYGDGKCPACCKYLGEVGSSIDTYEASASCTKVACDSLVMGDSLATSSSCALPSECRSTWRSRRKATAVSG